MGSDKDARCVYCEKCSRFLASPLGSFPDGILFKCGKCGHNTITSRIFNRNLIMLERSQIIDSELGQKCQSKVRSGDK